MMRLSKSIAAVLLALTLGALACNLGAPAATPTPAETSTPYVATADPFTPAAGGGDSNPTPFFTACIGGPATLPDTPPAFADFAPTILDTINNHSSIQAIDLGLRAWEGVTDDVGAVNAWHDLTGDGITDLVVVVRAPADQFPDPVIPGPNNTPGYPGDLYIFTCPNGTASLIYADRAEPLHPTPVLITLADINKDSIDEVVYTRSTCGASTCLIQARVIGWDKAAQKIIDLFPTSEMIPSGSVELIDVDGDGVIEIVEHVGGYGSAGAGAQRSVDNTYGWDGTQYIFKSRVVTSEQYTIHYLNDADDAAEAGDYAAAIPLYQHVIDDPNPKTWLSPDEIPALKAYARYRLMLTHALSGDMASAEAVHTALAADFANTPAGSPGASFAHFADLFWQAYQPAQDAKAGCEAVIALAASDDTTYSILNTFGYANKVYNPEDLCIAK